MAEGNAAARANSIGGTGRTIDPALRDILINPNNCDMGSIRTAENLNNILDFGDPMPRLTKRGRCDPNYWSLRQACERWRYSKGLFLWTYDLASNTYRSNSSTVLTLFQAGVNDAATSQNFPAGTMSETETDAFKGGAMADNLQLFQVRSLGIGLGIPFVKGTQYGSAPWTKRYSSAVFGAGYLPIFQSVTLDNFNVVASYPQASPQYNLGPMSAWMPHANTQIIGQTASSGWQFGAGSIVPIDGELGGGSQDSRAQLQLSFQQSSQYNLEIENTIAQNPPPVIYVPAVAFAYGFQTADCSSVEQCGVLTEDQLQGAFMRMMAQTLGVPAEQVATLLSQMRSRALPAST